MDEEFNLRTYYDQHPNFFPPIKSGLDQGRTYMDGLFRLTLSDIDPLRIGFLESEIREMGSMDRPDLDWFYLQSITYFSSDIHLNEFPLNFTHKTIILEYFIIRIADHNIKIDDIEDAIDVLSNPIAFMHQVEFDGYLKTLLSIGFQPDAPTILFMRNRIVPSEQ